MSQEGVPQHSCLVALAHPQPESANCGLQTNFSLLDAGVVGCENSSVQTPLNHHKNDPDIVTEVEVVLHLHWQVTYLTGISVFRDSTVQIHYNQEKTATVVTMHQEAKSCVRGYTMLRCLLPAQCRNTDETKLSASHSTLI